MFPIEQLFVSWDPKPRDSHFNAEGYRLLVHALADHIETQSLLR
jgi:lysophospholipase L1-like esterase